MRTDTGIVELVGGPRDGHRMAGVPSSWDRLAVPSTGTTFAEAPELGGRLPRGAAVYRRRVSDPTRFDYVPREPAAG